MTPALAAPADLGPDPDLQRRFGGLERLYGVPGAQRIRAARVAVVGLGGVGSWAAEALARSGVAELTLIDLDHVSESNINRQIHALDGTIGQAKVRAMQQRIAAIHPGCQVHAVDEFVEAANWPGLLQGRPLDALIDACDDSRAKLLLAAWARQSGLPFITVGAAGGKRLAHLAEVDDLGRSSHDPLLASLRQRLRREHGAPRNGAMGLACVFSREAVAPPDASCQIEGGEGGDGSLNCHGYGSVVSVTATFGMCAAGWVLDVLARGPRPAAQ